MGRMTAHEIGIAVLTAWNAHHKRTSFETKNLILPMIMGMELNWEAFMNNGELYRHYWEQRGWQYCTETLLGWVRNGCLPPPGVKNIYKRREPQRMCIEEYRQMLIDGGEPADEANRLAELEYSR